MKLLPDRTVTLNKLNNWFLQKEGLLCSICQNLEMWKSGLLAPVADN